MTDSKILELETKANDIRMSIIEMLVEAGSGHTAGPLGMADIFTLLFFHALKHDPKNPGWPARDRVVLSNGHICPVYYATLAHSGYLPVEELKTLRKFGTRLQGHPHREYLPILETSSGPLGAGLSQAVGMAIADRMDGGQLRHKIGEHADQRAGAQILAADERRQAHEAEAAPGRYAHRVAIVEADARRDGNRDRLARRADEAPLVG